MLLFTYQAIFQRYGAPALITSKTGYGLNLTRFSKFQVCVLIISTQMLLHINYCHVWVPLILFLIFLIRCLNHILPGELYWWRPSEIQEKSDLMKRESWIVAFYFMVGKSTWLNTGLCERSSNVNYRSI